MKLVIEASPEFLEQLQQRVNENQSPLGANLQSVEVLGQVGDPAKPLPSEGATDQVRIADDELMVRLSKGDGKPSEAALSELYQRHVGSLLRAASQMVGDQQIAVDIVQETFITVWMKSAQYHGVSSVGNWLHTILRNKALDHLRQSRQTTVSLDDVDTDVVESAMKAEAGVSAASHDANLHSSELNSIYHRCARRFELDDPRAASVLRMLVEGGMTVEEISKVLERSPSATREYISQVRRKARQYFAEWYRHVT